MAIRLLIPSDVECLYLDQCSKREYSNCINCRNNEKVVKKIESEKAKNNYFKRIV